LPSGWRVIALDAVGSTNDEAKTLAAAGAPHGTVVWAGRQEAGRGRRNRAWTSPEGNLYCSTILRPDTGPAAAGQLAFVVALSLADAVAAVAPAATLSLKWPNDVLVNGRKVAGILLESSIRADDRVAWVVAGTGVNIRHCPEGTAFPATALDAEVAAPIAPAALLEAYLAALAEGCAQWQRQGFAPIRLAWLARAHGLGGPVTVQLERETLTGRFLDLDAEGGLILDLPGGRQRRVAAGDVFFGGG
jgi:BirA family biotin operon repressor/biotin-[acetyl-CoA-carboxylase] ligase